MDLKDALTLLLSAAAGYYFISHYGRTGAAA